jgi:hypothetical protein
MTFSHAHLMCLATVLINLPQVLTDDNGIYGPALELGNPESHGSPCEPSNDPTPAETFAVTAGGMLQVGGLCVAGLRGSPSPFGPLQLWGKPLAAGSIAVLLANRGASSGAADGGRAPPTRAAGDGAQLPLPPVTVRVNLADLPWPDGAAPKASGSLRLQSCGRSLVWAGHEPFG